MKELRKAAVRLGQQIWIAHLECNADKVFELRRIQKGLLKLIKELE